MAFDASPSWSGFNYQGKVALYHTLKLINKESTNANLSKFSLMFENIEDFEILLNGSPLSLHQVKAYNSSTYSKYSEALLEITLELHKQPNAVGYVHTWKEINSKPQFDDLTTSIRDDLNQILTQYRNTNPKVGSTLLEKAASDEKNICKQAAILRAAFKGKTADQLHTILESIKSDPNGALSKLNSYQYDDGNRFCDLNDINTKIMSEISTALKAREIIVTPEQLEKTFHYFLGLIDQYVIQRHKEKQESIKIPITFTEIVNILIADHEDISEEYLAFKFKECFSQQIYEYMCDPDDYEDRGNNKNCNLKETTNVLLSLSAGDLWAHYRNFSPHIYLNHANNTENALAINTEGIRHVLIKIFHSMNFERASHNTARHRFTYRQPTLPHQHYLPTTITKVAKPRQIERQITANPSMSEILFEVQNLIYDGTEIHEFSPTALLHTEAPDIVGSDSRSKRDELLKYISLVPVETARKKLENDSDN